MSYRLSVPDRIALGLAAGFAGTSIMTIGQHIEMAISGRKPSRSPARAVETIAKVELASPEDELRASFLIHLAYGTALGIGLVALERIKDPWRTAIFLATVWSAGAALLAGLDLAPPPHRQRPAKLATDIGHHIVYASTAGLAYQFANRRARSAGLGSIQA